MIGLLLLTGNIFAGINANAGNSAAQFLKISPGGRIPGLGNAGTSLGGNAESMFYNPAGIGYLDNMEISVNFSRLFEDMNYISASVGMPIEGIGTVGIGFIDLFYGDIPVVIQDSSGELSESGSTGAGDMAFLLSWGKEIGDILMVGCNAKMIYQTLEDEKSTSFAFDVGGMKKLLDDKLGIGLAVQNLGTESKFMESGFSLPLVIRFGTSYEVLEIDKHKGILAVDILKPMDDNIKINAGMEYGFNNFIFLRAGYRIGNDMAGLTLGGGARIPIGNNITMADYAYVPYGDFGATHRIGLSLAFEGPKTEEPITLKPEEKPEAVIKIPVEEPTSTEEDPEDSIKTPVEEPASTEGVPEDSIKVPVEEPTSTEGVPEDSIKIPVEEPTSTEEEEDAEVGVVE